MIHISSRNLYLLAFCVKIFEEIFKGNGSFNEIRVAVNWTIIMRIMMMLG